MKSRHLQVCSPRLCWLRTDELAPASKYWMFWSHAGDMWLVRLVVYRQQMVTLPPLLQWLSWERNWVRTHRSASRHAVDCVGRSFSRERWLCPSLLTTREKLLHMDHVRYVWSRVIRRPSMKCVWRVDQVFPVACISIQITATLGYE
jgi:hypothetical protein